MNEYNLIELVAEGDNLLTDSEYTNTFKKVICKKEDAKKRNFLYNRRVLLLNTFTIWIERGGAVSDEQSGSILRRND